MLKKDRIFWWAAGIFLLSILLFAITGNDLWVFLIIASYLLRPTLASLGLGGRMIDERQMVIQYRSGNIAFTVMLIAAVVMAAVQYGKGDPNWDMYNGIIIAGLATKALFNLILVKNFRVAAARILIAVGLLIALFAVVSHFEQGMSLGMFMEALPGLTIAAIGWLSTGFPRTAGTLVFVAAGALVVLIISKGFTATQILVALIVSVPLTFAGASLFVRDRDEAGGEEKGLADPGIQRRRKLIRWGGVIGGVLLLAACLVLLGKGNSVRVYERVSYPRRRCGIPFGIQP